MGIGLFHQLYLSPGRLRRSIDALLQRPSQHAAAAGAPHTDVIILTHDTVEGRMTQAIAQMQALPTVLAKIVRIRKEDLA